MLIQARQRAYSRPRPKAQPIIELVNSNIMVSLLMNIGTIFQPCSRTREHGTAPQRTGMLAR